MKNTSAWILLSLAACGPIDNESDYIDGRAAAECQNIERCSLGYFESEFRDQDDCAKERADDIEESNEFWDDQDCNYVPGEAGFCVRRIRSFSCEEWAENEAGSACDLVWNCLES